MDEEQRDRISDLADMEDDSRVIWSDDEELEHFKHANLEWWLREALGHPRAHPGCCKTCGCATTCMAAAFFDATVLSTIRRLDELGLLRPPPSAFEQDHAEDIQDPESVEVERSQDETLNDPYQLWGKHPSYRCWVARHGQCEPEGADKGCTCSCGHQDPVCVCNSRETGPDGKVVHFFGCPSAEMRLTFHEPLSEENRRLLRERFGTKIVGKVVKVEDTRGPVTWCEHGADRHDAESGCIECRCIWRTGHEGPDTVRAL